MSGSKPGETSHARHIEDHAQLKNPALLREQAYIDGAWVCAADGGTFPVTNPADGSLVANVPQLGVPEPVSRHRGG